MTRRPRTKHYRLKLPRATTEAGRRAYQREYWRKVRSKNR